MVSVRLLRSRLYIPSSFSSVPSSFSSVFSSPSSSSFFFSSSSSYSKRSLQVVTATDGICVTAVTGSIQPHFPIPLTHNPTISPSFLLIFSFHQPLMHKLILSCGFPNRGFGFVTFADTEGVDKVLEFGTHELDGKKVI